MDFGKSALAVVALAVGGIALYMFTRKSGDEILPDESGTYVIPPEGGTVVLPPPEVDPGSITVGGAEIPFPTVPGKYRYRMNPITGEYELVTGYEVAPTEELGPPLQEVVPEIPVVTELHTVIPGELIPHVGAGGWYERRQIHEALGWGEQEYQEQIALAKVIPTTERTWQQEYAGGYSTTIEQAKGVTEFKDRVQLYGGDYIGGILVPPGNWGGSVTEYARYVRSSIDRTGMGWIN